MNSLRRHPGDGAVLRPCQHACADLTLSPNPIRSPCPGILATAMFRGAATPLFFAYIYGWLPPLDDAVVIAYVAVFWFTSGWARPRPGP